MGSRHFKTEDQPVFDEAAKQAALLSYGPWIEWMRTHTKYAQACRMANHIGIKHPGSYFYAKMRGIGKKDAKIKTLHNVFVEAVAI